MQKNQLNIKNKVAAIQTIESYKTFIGRLDQKRHILNEQHKDQIACINGCSACCQVNRTVNYLEAFWLQYNYQHLSQAKKNTVVKHLSHTDTCPLLIQNSCVLYPYRPVICRTHGLPLLYHTENQTGITFCELNFKNRFVPFTDDNILNMDSVNLHLLQLDQKWSRNVLKTDWEGSRIAIRDLIPLNSEISF